MFLTVSAPSHCLLCVCNAKMPSLFFGGAGRFVSDLVGSSKTYFLLARLNYEYRLVQSLKEKKDLIVHCMHKDTIIAHTCTYYGYIYRYSIHYVQWLYKIVLSKGGTLNISHNVTYHII